MEIKNIHKDADWYASYMDSLQGRALIKCQSLKIKQLENLIDVITGELELRGLASDELVLDSIESLLSQQTPVEVTKGCFKWEG